MSSLAGLATHDGCPLTAGWPAGEAALEGPQAAAHAVAVVAERAPGAALPRRAYTDPGVFAADLEAVFSSGWLFAGHTSEVAEPGDYLVYAVGDESVIVVRDRDGELRAHHNVCRHRGSRILAGGSGRARSLQCPYHQWTYGLDGALRGARLMGADFDPSGYALRPAHVRDAAGLLFIAFADEPPDFAPAEEAIVPQLAPHRLDTAKVVARDRYDVAANWKVLVENNRECYHCRVAHPEFSAVNYDLGLPGDTRSDDGFSALLADAYTRWEALGLAPADVSFPDDEWFRVTRLPLRDGYLTETLDGQLAAPLLGDLASADTGSLRVIGLPNLWAHVNCDSAMTTRLTPTGPDSTRVDVAYLVRGDAVAGTDYDADELAAVWRATCEQDWQLCEQTHAGIRSKAYVAGPLSPVVEASVEQFLGWYERRLRAAC